VGAYRFLSAQQHVHAGHVAIFGHSEGALFALALAAGAGGPALHPATLALLEPPGLRYLTLLLGQLDAQIARARAAGHLDAAAVARQLAIVASTVARIRAHGSAPPGLPSGLAQLFTPINARFLARADELDPARLAARLPPRLPVLISCSDADQNVTCAQAERLSSARPGGAASPGLVRQFGVSHELALAPSVSSPSSAMPAPLPLTAPLPRAIATWTARLR